MPAMDLALIQSLGRDLHSHSPGYMGEDEVFPWTLFLTMALNLLKGQFIQGPLHCLLLGSYHVWVHWGLLLVRSGTIGGLVRVRLGSRKHGRGRSLSMDCILNHGPHPAQRSVHIIIGSVGVCCGSVQGKLGVQVGSGQGLGGVWAGSGQGPPGV